MTVPSEAPMYPLRLLAAFLLVATSVLAPSTTSGASSGQSAAQPRPVFHSGLDLVRMDIRATDDEGRPVTDLRPEELQIEEEGTPRPVLLFQHIEAPRGTYAEAAQRTIAAEVSTNQGSPRGHVYVLVFDESHILPGHEQRARHAAERFLRTHVRSGDRVALYALPGPGPQIEFTMDVFRVIRELTAVRGMGEDAGSSAGIPGTIRTDAAYAIARGNEAVLQRQVNEATQSILASDTRTAGAQRKDLIDLIVDPRELSAAIREDARSRVAQADGETRRFLLGLADVVRTLRTVDGRKAVILFSEGFDGVNVTHELEDVAAAAAQSYSVIYAMDLNPRTVDANDDTPVGGEQFIEIRDKLQSVGSLAAETSGTLVTDASSQLDRALARIADTTEDYYLVGFTPAAKDERGRDRYRRVHVTVTRPGVHVSARTGYALDPRSTPADRRRTIDAALRAPFAQQGLQVEYTTYILRGTVGGLQRVVVSLAAELPVASADARTADVVYVARDVATGRVSASGSDLMALPAAPQDGRATTGRGLFRVQFELPAGTYLMRAVVREPGGLLGSADRRFQVRALNGPDVAASDLVLDSSDVTGLPVRATAYVSDLLTGVFELYGRSEAQLQGLTVTTDLVPLEGGRPAVSASAELQPVSVRNDGGSRAARIELPLANAAPGPYLVRATIRRGDDTITELLRDVTVRAGPRPAAATTTAAPGRLEPQNVLRGEIAGTLLQAIETRAKGSALEAAARPATVGNWPALDAALASSTSGSPDASTLRGVAAFARADYTAAIAAFRAAQLAGANDPALAFVLGWAYAASGDDRAAITAWRSAIVRDATLVPPYLALVDAYLRLGQSDLARQVVKSGLHARPGSAELLERLARLEGGL